MDFTDLATLAGQDLTTEQATEAIAAILTTFPKLHTSIRQEGFRAGLSMTKLEYEKEDKTGKLDKALASIATHDASMAERDEQIASLSKEKPDVATMQAEHNLLIKGLQDKQAQLAEKSLTKEAEYTTTLLAKDREIFQADLERKFQGMSLKPRELRFAVSETRSRFKRDGDEWKVYEEDGVTPLLVDDQSTAVDVLAASYAGPLPKEAFIDKRNHGLDGEFKGASGGSSTMHVTRFREMSPQAKMDFAKAANKSGGELVD